MSDAATQLAPNPIPSTSAKTRILCLGGGSVGLYAALRLHRRLKKDQVQITVIDPRPYMQYAPFLPEAGAGNIDARDVVAPHRKALKHLDVLQGKVIKIDHANKTVTVEPEEGDNYQLAYDHVVVGLGSVSRTLPIPGLAENGIGFKNVEEAIAVRNHVLNRMDVAASTTDPKLRQAQLTFTFIGGGFAGIEAVAEIEDMARYATRAYETIVPEDLHFTVIEGAPRILPEVSPDMSQWAFDRLQERGIKIYLNTFLTSCVDGRVVTSGGVEFDSETIVWTAGVKSNPVLAESSDLPLDRIKRVTVKPTLQVVTEDGDVVQGAWAAGDCAAVPDVLNEGKFCPPNAQYAIREARVLADNIVAELRGKPVKDFVHKNVGVVCSLGKWKGVAEFANQRIKIKGPLAWLAHRAYHVMAMPTGNRKTRILIGWAGQALLGREIISLGSVEDPRHEFKAVAVPAAPPGVTVEQKAESAAATGVAGEVASGHDSQ
ncbi:MAG: NAD(P)/FAD-dependent oxidoreductase [Cellulomonadaceae bacterium]|jgi:NADH dehydrogenase|nr:NAD(P)/FAD-dependent oxidoreductase [Cellulomonadaceae bacterium]